MSHVVKVLAVLAGVLAALGMLSEIGLPEYDYIGSHRRFAYDNAYGATANAAEWMADNQGSTMAQWGAVGLLALIAWEVACMREAAESDRKVQQTRTPMANPPPTAWEVVCMREAAESDRKVQQTRTPMAKPPPTKRT